MKGSRSDPVVWLLRALRPLVGVSGLGVIWALVVLLTADRRPHAQTVGAQVFLGLYLAGFVLLVYWPRRALRPQPAPVDEGWPKTRH